MFLLFCTVALSITVAVSIRPLELIVKHILPEGHNVVCIMDRGTNPHLYQLKTSDLKVLNEADLIVLVGFEEWAEKVADMFADKTIVFADDLFWKDFEQDEHLWLDPVNVLLFSHKLMLKLSQVEPASSENFEANWLGFSKRLLAKFRPSSKYIQHSHTSQNVSTSVRSSVWRRDTKKESQRRDLWN